MAKSDLRPATVADQEALAEHANAIRALGDRVKADVIEIGRRLTQAKAIARHGHWLPWLEREFKWHENTAINFMRFYELSIKSTTVVDLDLPMRAFYMLAAPSTPPEAIETVIERAEAGETLTGAEVKKIVHEAKSHKPKVLPSPAFQGQPTEGRRSQAA